MSLEGIDAILSVPDGRNVRKPKNHWKFWTWNDLFWTWEWRWTQNSTTEAFNVLTGEIRNTEDFKTISVSVVSYKGNAYQKKE